MRSRSDKSSLLRLLFRTLLKEEDYERIFAKPLIRERFDLIATAGLARIFGGRLYCYRCGERLPKVLAFMKRGQLRVWGLQQEQVSVEFADRQTLRFAHVIPEACVRRNTFEQNQMT